MSTEHSIIIESELEEDTAVWEALLSRVIPAALEAEGVTVPCEVDVLSGRYVVDGKSIMGLFSLDLSQPVKVEVRGVEEEREAFFRSLAPFAAEPPRQA